MENEQRARAEQMYVSGAQTLRELAEETGVSVSTLSRWCKQGGWVKKRERVQKRAMRKAADRAVDRKARELSRLIQASGELERGLLAAAKGAADILAEEGGGEMLDGKRRSANFANMAGTLERLAAARQIMGFTMSQAENEKVRLDNEKLRLDREKHEFEIKKAADANGSAGVRVEIEPAAEDLAE